MPSKHVVIYTLILFMASSMVMALVCSFVAEDFHSIEYLADFGDTESEKEEKKTEERKINHRYTPITFRIKANQDLLQEMMHKVDLASLYHPEITTPPPEVI